MDFPMDFHVKWTKVKKVNRHLSPPPKKKPKGPMDLKIYNLEKKPQL